MTGDSPFPTPVALAIYEAEARRKADGCPHRTPLGGCRCSGICGLGRGELVDLPGHGSRRVASLDDCHACPE